MKGKLFALVVSGFILVNKRLDDSAFISSHMCRALFKD
jgi:hypothetical protein